jgi:hypothetical protein
LERLPWPEAPADTDGTYKVISPSVNLIGVTLA